VHTLAFVLKPEHRAPGISLANSALQPHHLQLDLVSVDTGYDLILSGAPDDVCVLTRGTLGECHLRPEVMTYCERYIMKEIRRGAIEDNRCSQDREAGWGKLKVPGKSRQICLGTKKVLN
jgi:hypothetical protein